VNTDYLIFNHFQMKKLLLSSLMLIFTITAYGQLPELIYYQFENSAGVTNYASSPVGTSPATIAGQTIGSGGFLNSNGLVGTGASAATNKVTTGWNTTINGSFSLAFWVNNTGTGTTLYYIFGDAGAASFRCFTNGVAGANNWMLRGAGLPDLLVTGGASSGGKMIHAVYDDVAGTYTSYIDGVQNTQVTVATTPNQTGTGLTVGGYASNSSLSGVMDEFRWYSRALTQAEITATHNIDLNFSGNCANAYANVSTDSILATTAQVNWTPGTGNSSFWLEYGLAGFTPGSGTKITGSYPGAQPPVNITGLSINTTYEYYLGEICNSGADSVYAASPYQFKTTKLCAPATNLAATNIFATSADISWSHAGGANSFTIYYGAGLSQTATSSPYTLTGLTSNTAYDIYVVADCGTTNGISDSIGPASFFTPCTITTAPFIENFDGTTWIASGNNNANSIDQCWSSSPATSTTTVFKWIPRSTAPTSGNGPLVDKTGGNFMYCEASGSASGNVAELISPQIDASGLTTPGLYFEQHRFSNATIADMQVQVSNDFGTTWDTVYTVAGDIQTSNSAPWLLEFVNLAAYTGDTIMVKFVQIGNGCCGDAAIDKVEIKEAPTCPWPTSVNVPITTSTTAIADWTDPSGTSWDLEWGPVGFTQGTGAIKTTSNNPDTITGLAPNNEYDLYVRANCVSGGNGFSIWIGPIYFRTQCAPFTAPYTNNFDTDANNTTPICWSSIATYGNNNAWARATTIWAPANSGTQHLGLYNQTGFTAADDLGAISPEFSDLTAGDKRISFYAKSTEVTAKLLVGTTDGITINVLDTVTFSSVNSYNFYIVDLTTAAGYNGTDSHVFMGYDLASALTFDYILIDDFNYETAPACNPPAPNTLGAIPGITSATVFWGSGSAGDATEVQWGTPNFMQGTGVLVGSTTVNGTVDTTVATGLTGNTQYEFWIRDSCNVGGFSPWIGPFSFFTLCSPLNAPFVENFDGSSWVASGNNTGNSINNCWSSSPDVSQGAEPFKWIPRSTGPTSGNGPLNDNTGLNFMYCEASGSTSGDIAYLTSPLIDVSSLTAPALYFDQHRFSATIADLNVEVSNDFGATWTNVYTITGQVQTSAAAAWSSEFVNLPIFVGDTIVVRFVQTGNGCCGDAAIDNVEIKEAPTCPDPGNLGASSVSDTAATFTWLGSLTSVYNEVWWGPTGFFQGTGTTGGTKMTTTTDSLTVDTLMDGTCYDYYVRSVCGPGDTTIWIGPYTFCTNCKTFTAPFFEDFDGPSWSASGSNLNNQINQCWSSSPDVSQGTEPFKWIPRSTGPTSGNGPLTDNTGGNFMYCEASGSASGDIAYLNTPPIDMTPLSNPGMYFDEHRFSTTIADLDVEISTDFGNTWTNIYTVTGQVQTSAAAPWTTQFIDLSAYNTNTVIVRFVQTGNGCCGDAAIDNVIINSVVADDLEILAASFDRNDPCLTTNDTIKVSFINNIGGSVNFATTPLTVNYDVTGPVNTNSSIIVNSGTLASGDTLEVMATNIDLSSPGMYSLDAYLDSNSINLDPYNDTLWMAATIDIKAPLDAKPDTVTFINNMTDTVNLEASSPFFGGGAFHITEIMHFKTATGAPAGGWPAWHNADEHIEITGVPGSDLAGITFEQWNTTGTTPTGSYTFPSGSLIGPNGTAIVAMRSVIDSPSDFFYDGSGGNTIDWQSGGGQGVILKDASGSIIDAAVYPASTGLYTFPAAAGVTTAEWAGGTMTGAGGTCGRRLEGPDLNDATGWITVSAASPQDPNVVNSNVVVPSAGSVAGFTWTLNGTVIDTSANITVGPYTASGIYNYVAEFVTPCGLLTDTVVVVVNLGGCVPPTALAMSNITCSDADISWTSDAGTLLSFVRFDTTGFNPATGGTLLINPSSPATLTGLMPGTTYDVWVADSCATGAAGSMITFTTASGPLPTIAVSYTQTSTTLSSAVVSFDATGSTGVDTYTWDFGGGSMGTGVNATFTYAANGTFPVTLTVTNGCGSVDSTFNVIVQGISIEESALGQSLSIFPNPSDGNFNLSFTLESSENVELRVLNSAGQIILKNNLGSIDKYDGSIDLSNQAKGMYILQIETSNGTVNRRVTIQ
jgi:hypothetical protein